MEEIAILGVGMHPWGKWGRNFTDYGTIAARDALADSGVDWNDVGFRSGRLICFASPKLLREKS